MKDHNNEMKLVMEEINGIASKVKSELAELMKDLNDPLSMIKQVHKTLIKLETHNIRSDEKKTLLEFFDKEQLLQWFEISK